MVLSGNEIENILKEGTKEGIFVKKVVKCPSLPFSLQSYIFTVR
jgi:hypothetical protein